MSGPGGAESARERGALSRALLVVAALHLVGLGWLPLLEPDEGRYADIAREFLHATSWIVPHANGSVFLDKPPLVPWLGALALRLLGPSALALRLIPALSGVLAAGVAAWLARCVYGRRAGPLAALVYATSPLALFVGRTFVLDVPLAALVTLGLGLVLRGAGALTGGGGPSLAGRSPLAGARGDRGPSHLSGVLGGVAIGLATLVKGPVAIGLAGLGVLAALVVHARDRDVRLRLLSPLPWLTACLVAAPWALLVQREQPDFARIFLLGENLNRFAGAAVEHKHGSAFFVVTLLWGLGAWTAAALVLLLVRFRDKRRRLADAAAPDGAPSHRLADAAAPGVAPSNAATAGASDMRSITGPDPKGRAVLLAYSVLVVLFFSASSVKVETYILPAFPALAALIAGEVARALEGERTGPARRALEVTFELFAGLFVVALLAGAAFGLGWFPLVGQKARLAFAATHPLLALPPIPLALLAVRLLRRGSPLRAVGTLALALAAALPFVLGPVGGVASLRTAAPVGEAVAAARRPGQRVAVYHYYYRGLPFYVDEPVVLLGEKGELRDEAFGERPELFLPDLWMLTPAGRVGSDPWTQAFLRSFRPLLVVVPNGNHREQAFLEACGRAGVSPRLRGEYGDDRLYEVPE